MKVIALSGRLIDSAQTRPPRFPYRNVSLVTHRIADFFRNATPAALVCSAACGADLIALDAAERLGIDCHIVLPFDSTRFLETSVKGRPGEWESRYEHVIGRTQARGWLEIITDPGGSDHERYAAACDRILELGLELSGNHLELIVVAVWEGRKRGDDDLTARLLANAEHIGCPTASILTLHDAAPAD